MLTVKFSQTPVMLSGSQSLIFRRIRLNITTMCCLNFKKSSVSKKSSTSNSCFRPPRMYKNSKNTIKPSRYFSKMKTNFGVFYDFMKPNLPDGIEKRSLTWRNIKTSSKRINTSKISSVHNHTSVKSSRITSKSAKKTNLSLKLNPRSHYSLNIFN